MEEIKVGEYVRYKSGLIRKVSRIIPIYENDKLLKGKYYIEFDGKGDIATYISEQVTEFMTKHSPNIIDLIEEGDYVNGYRVVDIMEDMKTGELHLEMTSDYTNQEIGDCTIYNKDIKSIVTKEQMQSIEYKLEERN